MNYEMIVAGMMKFMTVLKPEWEYAADELLGDKPYFTLDRQYYVMVEEAQMDTVRRALEVLFENHRGRYVAILEGILTEMEYEAEEEAFRYRECRLSERGFPDYETARSVYVPMDRSAFEVFEEKKGYAIKDGDNVVRPNYPVLWQMQPLFFDRAMANLSEDMRALDQVYEELAWLSNKLIVCHGMDFTYEEKIKWSVERARSIVSLALETLTEGDTAEASRLLRARWIETLFRYGIYELRELRTVLERTIADHWGAKEILKDFLEPPYEYIVMGILDDVPMAYDFEMTEHIYNLRNFRDQEDLRRAKLSLEQIESISAFVLKQVPGFARLLSNEPDPDGQYLTMTPVLSTFFAREVLGKSVSVKPVSFQDVERFAELLFYEEGGRINIREGLKEKFLSKYFTEKEADKLRPLWGLIFQQIREELRPIWTAKKIEEPRLISCIRIGEDKKDASLNKKKPAKKKTGKDQG